MPTPTAPNTKTNRQVTPAPAPAAAKTPAPAPAKAPAPAAPATAKSAAKPATPAREEIAKRAYELYLARGKAGGKEMEDWIQAERELSARSNGRN